MATNIDESMDFFEMLQKKGAFSTKVGCGDGTKARDMMTKLYNGPRDGICQFVNERTCARCTKLVWVKAPDTEPWCMDHRCPMKKKITKRVQEKIRREQRQRDVDANEDSGEEYANKENDEELNQLMRNNTVEDRRSSRKTPAPDSRPVANSPKVTKTIRKSSGKAPDSSSKKNSSSSKSKSKTKTSKAIVAHSSSRSKKRPDDSENDEVIESHSEITSSKKDKEENEDEDVDIGSASDEEEQEAKEEEYEFEKISSEEEEVLPRRKSRSTKRK